MQPRARRAGMLAMLLLVCAVTASCSSVFGLFCDGDQVKVANRTDLPWYVWTIPENSLLLDLDRSFEVDPDDPAIVAPGTSQAYEYSEGHLVLGYEVTDGVAGPHGESFTPEEVEGSCYEVEIS